MTDGPLPASTELSHLSLHSPSRIIGTPFATTSARFEYPFPDCSTSSPAINNSPASSPGSICISTCGSSASHSSSFGSVSFSLPRSLPSSAQFHRSIALVAPAGNDHPHSSHATVHNHNHPKLRLQNPPPMPPTLVNKRNRWNLAFLGLKKDVVASADDGAATDTRNVSEP